MRFSVDAHAVGRKLTGNEVYVRSLLEGYAALDRDSEFIAYVSEPEAAGLLPQGIRCERVARSPFLRLGWDLAAQVRRHRPDLLHVQYTAPLICSAPVVVSVHDVSYLDRPDLFPQARVFQLTRTVPRTVRMARRILAPSEFSARAICRVYKVPRDRVTVIPNGVSGTFRPLSREQARAEVSARFGIAGPYILTVGVLQPRKNQVGLIDAFERLIAACPEMKHDLVLAGKDSWFSSRIHERAQRSPLRDRIRLTGWVPDEDLVYLYGGCDVFAFPSLYEGFGIPILEAMACGRPVACSNTTATVEVADGAALTFQPESPDDIARALRDLLVDSELRARMERLGVQRAAQFDWRETARRTLEVYYEVAGTKTPAALAVPAVPVAR